MVLKSQQKVQPLTAVQEKRYLKRCELSHEIGAMKRRMEELEADRKKLDVKLAPIFEQFDGRRKLSNGIIVERKIIDIEDIIITKDMVGKVSRTGFSYPRYKEISG